MAPGTEWAGGFSCVPSLPQPTLPSSTSAGHPKHRLGCGGTRHFLPLPPLCDGTERHFDCHSLSACLFYEGRFQQFSSTPHTPYNGGGTKGFGARTHKASAPKKYKKTEQKRKRNKSLPESFCLSSFSPFSPASNASFGIVI